MRRKQHEGMIRIDQAGIQKIAVYPKETISHASGFKFKGLELVPVK